MMIHVVVTTCGEKQTIDLLKLLDSNCGEEYNLWCLKDSTKEDEAYKDIDSLAPDSIRFIRYPMEGNFSEFRNSIHELIDFGDYVLQLDADEEPQPHLFKILPYLLEANPNVDLFYLPRNNYVEGITDEYIAKMMWRKDSKGRINYPDPQGRLYKYREGIQWSGKVHETIAGHNEFTLLSHDWAHLDHKKTFERQIKQNKLYDEITE